MIELEHLRRLSSRLGADPLLVQAAGGNTSIKLGDVMWIKASGTWLRDADSRDIFVPVQHQMLLAALARDDPACENGSTFVRADLDASGLRPSIETAVHAIMPQRVVIHVHCVNTVAWAIRRDAALALADRLGAFAWAFIPYCRPGLPLARAIRRKLTRELDVLILGNHGLVVAGDSVAEAGALLDNVVSALRRPVRRAAAPNSAALESACLGTEYRLAISPDTHALATDPFALALAETSVYYPDHFVFIGTGVATKIESGAPLVAVPGKGVLIHRSAVAAVEPIGRCLADVLRRVEPDDPVASLSDRDIRQLADWEAETYRRGMNITF